MEAFLNEYLCFANDRWMYPIVQLSFILFVLFAISKDIRIWWIRKYRKSGFSGTLTRAPQEMGKFHTTYVALSFLLVLIILNVEILKDYKVFFILINIISLAYLCYFNGWFRNKLASLILKASSDVEKF